MGVCVLSRAMPCGVRPALVLADEIAVRSIGRLTTSFILQVVRYPAGLVSCDKDDADSRNEANF